MQDAILDVNFAAEFSHALKREMITSHYPTRTTVTLLLVAIELSSYDFLCILLIFF